MKLAPVLRTPALAAALAMAFGGVALTASWPASAQPASAGESGDPVVAKVNGEEIHKSEVDRVIATLPPQVQMMPPQMIMPAVVEQIINGKLIAQQGYKENLQNDPAVKARLKTAEERLVQEAYLTREIEKRITDERLQEAYKKYLQENPPKPEVKASHILVESEEKAKEIIKKLNEGANFADLAKAESKDPGAAARGGDLGYFTKDQMVEPFAEAAFAMEPGSISKEPVKTQFGWHVIKVEDKRTAPQPTFDEVKDELRGKLSEQIIGEMVESLRKEAKIETMDLPEAAPAESATPSAAPNAETPAGKAQDKPAKK